MAKKKAPVRFRGGFSLHLFVFLIEELLVLAGGFTHLLLPGLGTLLHLFGCYVLHMLRQCPIMPTGIADSSEAVAPELILQGHFDLRAGFHSAIEERIHV